MVDECMICWHNAHPKRICKVLEDDPTDIDWEEICGCNESISEREAYQPGGLIEEEIFTSDQNDYRRDQ